MKAIIPVAGLGSRILLVTKAWTSERNATFGR